MSETQKPHSIPPWRLYQRLTELEEQLEAQAEIVAAAREVYEGWLAGDFNWDRLAAALNPASEPESVDA